MFVALLLSKSLIKSAFLICNLFGFISLPIGLPINLMLTMCILLVKCRFFLLLISKLFRSYKQPIKSKHFLLTLLLTLQGPVYPCNNSKLRYLLQCILFRSLQGTSSPCTHTIVASMTTVSSNATTMAMTIASCIHSSWRRYYQVRKQIKFYI